MRRLPLAVTCCWLAVMAATGASAGDPAPAPLPAAQGFSTWQWLRARLFGAPAETPAAALARLGGSRLLLEADIEPARADAANDLRDTVRRVLRAAPVPFRDLTARDGYVEVRVRDVNDVPRAMTALAAAKAGLRDIGLRDLGDGLIRLTPSQRDMDLRLDSLFERNIATLTQRLRALGIANAGVQREGIAGIAVLLPGVKDATHVAEVLARRGQIEIRLVDQSADLDAAVKSGAPEGTELLYDKNKGRFVVFKQAPLTSADLAEVNPGFAPNGKDPVVDFRFTERGAKVFARLTEDNVGKMLAIVLDGVVISAPIVREPIRAGRVPISGNFTASSATDLALLLRSGALAFNMTLVDARTVEPAQN